VDLDEHLHIGETAYRGASQGQLQSGGDSVGKGSIAVAGNNFHSVWPPSNVI
jgi:hypothetical protein